MSVQFVLWDHDGVLVDTEPLFFEATARVLALQAEGRGIVRLLEEVDIKGAAQAEVRRVRNALYEELLAERDVLIDGARRAVEDVATAYRSVMVTTSLRRHVDQIHRRSGILEHFEHVVTAEDCEI